MSQPIFDLRVVRYEPAGDRAGVIPTISIESSRVRSGMPSLAFKTTSQIAGDLPDVIEAAVEEWSGTDWVERRDSRFLVVKSGRDDRDPVDVQSFEGVGLVDWLLAKLTLAEGSSDSTLEDGKRSFPSSTAGEILGTFLDEGQARGWGTFVSWDFDGTDDSDSAAWEYQITVAYEPGLPAWQALTNLAEQGVCDFHSEGRELVLTNPLPEQGSGETLVRVGDVAAQLPVNRDLTGLLTHATLIGDGITLDVENEGAYDGLGRLEVAITQGGVSDTGTATLLAQAELKRGSQARRELTAKYHAAAVNGASPSLPGIDYEVGDWVDGRISGDWEPVRVEQITLTKNEGPIEVGVTLNDRFMSDLARLAKRTVGITGGAVAGGSGRQPSDQDRRRPKAPTGLVVSSTGYWSKGIPLSAVAAEWTVVSQGENDVAIDVQGYELWGRLDSEAEPIVLTTSTEAEASWSPFTPGDVWHLAVRAQSRAGVWSALSDWETVTMADPAADLEAMSPPDVTTAAGIATITWNGTLATDPVTTPPRHFTHGIVELSPSSGDDFAPAGAVFIGQEQCTLKLGVGSTWWVRLVGVDSLGRQADPSDAVEFTVAGIDGADIIADTVTANAIAAGSIEVEHIAAGVGGQLDITANDSITIIAGEIEAVQDSVDGVAGDLADMRLRYDFDEDGLYIRKPGSSKQVVIDNEAVEIREAGSTTFRAESGQVTVDDLVATRVITPTHSIESTSNGLVFRSL